MSLNEEIRNILQSSETVDTELLRRLKEKYPFFTLPSSIQLKENSTLTDEERTELLKHIALNASDTNAVAASANSDINGFIPVDHEKPAISTDDAISEFLATYGSNDPHEEQVLTQLIFNPTPDYAQMLAREEEKNIPSDSDEPQADPQDRLINKFILSSREQGGHFPKENAPESRQPDDSPVSEPDTADHSMLTESLAKSYIRQKKYSKALEIITHLSLNYPEKSIYFADQLRFLRKAVLIEQYKNKQ